MELVIAALVGLGIGVVVGMLGAGGGILSVPAFVYLLGLSPHDAAASSLIVVLLSVVTALVAHHRHGHVNWRGGITFGAVSALAAVGGARLAPLLSGDHLMILFAVLLLGVTVMMLVRGVRERKQEDLERSRENSERADADAAPEVRPRTRIGALVAAASAVGILAGIFGVGGGFAVVPLLMLVFGYPVREAAGTSVLVMTISAIFGLLGRIGTPVNIDWPLVLVFAGFSAVGSALGEPLSVRARPSTLTIAFGVLLLIMASVTTIMTL